MKQPLPASSGLSAGKKYFSALLVCLLFFSTQLKSQIPTDQDCLGAIPICGPLYSTPSSTFGTGNYPNEDGPGTCLVPGEYNSLWFVFTVITSGNLAFTIIPISPFADYDWCLYNLTGASCEDIQTNGSLMVSCNSSQYGVTGISAAGIGNWNGPGPTNAFNYLLAVNAGETYVLNVNNWSGSNGGYSINFTQSTATIYDSVKPKIDTVIGMTCTDSSITFSFSENVLCSSVDDADFALDGPYGPYTVSNVTGSACSSGGTQEVTFTADVSPPIYHGGTYTFYLTGNSGGVEDLCGNISVPDSFSFFVNGVNANIDSVLSPYCAGSNGLVFSSGTQGLQPYTFSLNGTTNNTGNFIDLDDTTYLVTVTDAGGCWDTAEVTLYPATGTVQGVVDQFTDVKCYNNCDGTIIVSGTSGAPPYNYSWSNGASTSGIANLCIGNYTVIITDSSGCKDTLSVPINQPPPLVFTLDSISNPSCNGTFDGYVKVHVTGGTPGYAYTWVPYGGNSAISSHLDANTYTIEVLDAHGCVYDTIFTLTDPDEMIITYPGDTTICDGTEAKLNVPISGGTPPYSVAWNTGDNTNPLIFITHVDSSLEVFARDSHGCTSDQVEYRVQVLHQPHVDLGNDTIMCAGDVLYKNFLQPGVLYEWQDGSKFYDYEIKKTGLYWVRVYNACFEAIDSINLQFDDCSTCVHVPDAFTPNGDGINDVFKPVIGCYFTTYLLKVFNRWGQLMYASEDPDAGWDGSFQSSNEEVGTYIWQLQYQGSEHAKALDQQLTGYVVLIR